MGPDEGGVTPLAGAKTDLATMQATAQTSTSIAGEIAADHRRIDGELSAVWAKWKGEAPRAALQVWHGELSPQLDSLKQQLDQIAQAVHSARTNYGTTDDNRAMAVRAVAPATGGITSALSPGI
ncbi:WXG100 family type VII secretion target [Amycolatopsis taiwanensis]|uniref:WXG100 family type VII secretion target n=1 Tax=Amycolatopsis taiwanensis TaxID=342230 RepID=UPI00247FCBE0|nr:WXG100 family type VII secretion target [Amycolatopsis taiwanensis]